EFIEVAEFVKRLQRVVGIAEPAISVVPGTGASVVFGQARRSRSDNAPRIFILMQFEYQGGANNFFLVNMGHVRTLYPSLPEPDGLVDKILRRWFKGRLERFAIGKNEITVAIENKRKFFPDVSERNIGGKPHGHVEIEKAKVIAAHHHLRNHGAVISSRFATHYDVWIPFQNLQLAHQHEGSIKPLVLLESRRTINHAK